MATVYSIDNGAVDRNAHRIDPALVAPVIDLVGQKCHHQVPFRVDPQAGSRKPGVAKRGPAERIGEILWIVAPQIKTNPTRIDRDISGLNPGHLGDGSRFQNPVTIQEVLAKPSQVFRRREDPGVPGYPSQTTA